MRYALPSILVGALLLSWPAVLNGYPIVFSDTFGFMEEGMMGYVGWNKPWFYGPFLYVLDWRISLWPVVVAQTLLLSAFLWITQTLVLGGPRPAAYLALCAVLAVGSAAPWFAGLVMPDIFAPVTVLGLFILSSGVGRLGARTLTFVTVVTIFAIACHLAHLILAAACIVVLLLGRPQRFGRAGAGLIAAPLLAALALLFASNVVAFRIPGISPYGSSFLLARLIADGPARDVIQRACPASGWYICDWADRLPADADAFLWASDMPLSQPGHDPQAFAAEAGSINRATLLAEPGRVVLAMLHNTLRQILRVRIGDTLTADYLAVTVRDTLLRFFPPAEVARFDSGLQAQGALLALAAPVNNPAVALLVLCAAGTAVLAITQWRGNRLLALLAALALTALVANAFATGALSGPHDRYQARIAWLVLLPPVFALARSRLRL